MANLTLERARQIATSAAEETLRTYAGDLPVLSDEYLISDYCWLFFKNPAIKIPPKYALHADWSYAVSKTGQVRQFYELEDREAMKGLLARLSAEFQKQNA